MSAHYSNEELQALGLGAFGIGVKISRKASLYNAHKISLGNHVRIDDYCIISAGEGGVTFGSHIHLAAHSSIIGGGAVLIDDYANISSRVNIYSSNDDYSGEYMTGPMVPHQLTNITKLPVKISKHVIIGCGSVILPNVVLEKGVAIGALSLVKSSCLEFGIYCGAPAKKIGERKRNFLELENLISSYI